MGYTTKEIAQACLNYVDPMCNVHHKNKLEVLQILNSLINQQINVMKSVDSDRNR